MRTNIFARRSYLDQRYVKLGFTLLLLSITLPAFAAKKVKKTDINQIACSKLLGGFYSDIARKEGIQFLMVTMNAESFARLIKASASYRPIFRASGLGVEDPSGLDVFSDPSERHDHSMKPLLATDQGKWAHQLIGGGSDAIGMGVRSKLPDRWQVGLIFPVEILDHIPFTITSTRTIRDRKMRTGLGRGGDLFDSRLDNAEDMFRDMLHDEISNHPYPESTDFTDYFQFHFEKGVPLEFAALYWIPAPLAKTAGDVGLPGLDSPLVPPAGSHFEVTISVQTPGIGDGWTPIQPPKEDLFEFFDPKKRVGTWFNTIPDWDVVREALDKSGQPTIPMLQYRAGEKSGKPRLSKPNRKRRS